MVGEQIYSERQHVVKVPKFVSDDEVAHLLALVEGKWQRSTVVDNKTGQSVVDEYRTGQVAGLLPGQDAKVHAIEERVANMAGTKLKQSEAMQIVKYAVGERYKIHHDWFDPNIEGPRTQLHQGGQRIKSAILCLKSADEGGETEFPNLGVKVKLDVGDLLMWDNLDKDGQITLVSDHVGCSVVKGEKIVATCWIRERAFDGSEEPTALELAEQAKKKMAAARAEAEAVQARMRKTLEEDGQRRVEACMKEINETVEKWGCRMVATPITQVDPRTGNLQIGAVIDLDPVLQRS
jgi:prolyl 4-hydroxylase